MNNSRTFFAVLVFIGLPFSIAATSAQDDPRRQIGPWVWGIQGGALHQFETDFSDAKGDFSLNRAFLQASMGYAWDRRHMVSVSLGVGDSDYDFSSGASIDGRDPWGQVRDYRLSVAMRFSPTENTDAIVIPSVRSDVEEGGSVDDGRTEGVLAGLGWKVSDTLTIGPGFGWYTELGGGSRAFPIVILDWAITDKLSLTTGSSPAASRGPGLTMKYSLSKKWQLSLSGRYEKTYFALDNDNNRPKGFGQDKSVPLIASAQYSPWPRTAFRVFAGSKLGGELSLENSNRNTLARSDYDTAILLGVSFSSRF